MQERYRPLSSTPRVICYLTLLLQERSLKNKMATLNKHTSVLVAILSDISDHSDTNFIHISPLSANKGQQQEKKTERPL